MYFRNLTSADTALHYSPEALCLYAPRRAETADCWPTIFEKLVAGGEWIVNRNGYFIPSCFLAKGFAPGELQLLSSCNKRRCL